jgi:hypothetical protein
MMAPLGKEPRRVPQPAHLRTVASAASPESLPTDAAVAPPPNETAPDLQIVEFESAIASDAASFAQLGASIFFGRRRPSRRFRAEPGETFQAHVDPFDQSAFDSAVDAP